VSAKAARRAGYQNLHTGQFHEFFSSLLKKISKPDFLIVYWNLPNHQGNTGTKILIKNEKIQKIHNRFLVLVCFHSVICLRVVLKGVIVNEFMRIQSGGMDSAVRQIGDSWSLLIVWSALQGTTRFDNFQSSLGVARNILSNRLTKLVNEGILVKRPVHSGARRLEYRVTGKGEALRPALELIEGWGKAVALHPTRH
jgi:DNA-binding HxlR family transcriptional regulator